MRPKLQRLGQGGQDFQLQACARGLRIDACHGTLELGAAPGAEILALEEHLWGVYEGDTLQVRELALALRELALGIGVLPADVVPVVDVQRQRHDLFGSIALAELR